jgi:cytochrome c peroxidase
MLRRRVSLLLPALAWLGGCAPEADPPEGLLRPLEAGEFSASTLIEEVRTLARDRNIGPLENPPPIRPALVELGRALAFDKELSGNRNIACMTCHLPAFTLGDGRHLSLGEGASGAGPARQQLGGHVIPRNAPPLFNLQGFKFGDATALFWDGRVQQKRNNRNKLLTPAGEIHMNTGFGRPFEFGPISALALFPVMSREEMRGQAGENELAAIGDNDFFAVWAAIMARLGRIPQYVSMFEAAYPGTRFADMTFAHASNAIAAFFLGQFSFNATPWDRFLRGDDTAMTTEQLEGARVFLGARCTQCHAGNSFSDFLPHNVALRQFGPGVNAGDDFGHFNVSGNPLDRYEFRTTPLRNVALTGPYGHAGQFVNLADFIDHYSESHLKLHSYDPGQLPEELRGSLVDNVDAVLATRDPILDGVVFDRTVVDQMTTFMGALTDPAALDLAHVIPATVPSGHREDGSGL